MKYFLMALMCLVSSSIMADDTPIPVEQLPKAVKTFVQTNFKDQKILYAEKDGSIYECRLADGTKIEFDMHGAWRRIGRNKTGVPAPLIPDAIKQYVKIHYPQDIVTKFSKKNYGYKLELSNDMDLRFNHQCQFLEEVD